MARAAGACRISQPTLSIQLRKLEQSLGVTLFERSRKGILFTPVGKAVLQIAEEILSKADEIKDISKASKDPLSGELKFGAFPTLAPYWFPKVIPILKKEFPTLRLQLFEEKSEILVEKLAKGELDCAALAMPIERKDFVSEQLFEEHFVLAVPVKHKLNKAALNLVSPSDIHKERLLLLEDGHCMRGQALSFCTSHGISEKENYRAASLETLRNMVAAGEGITLIPEIAVQNSDKRISYLKLAPPMPRRQIGLYWRRANPREELFEKIADLLNSGWR